MTMDLEHHKYDFPVYINRHVSEKSLGCIDFDKQPYTVEPGFNQPLYSEALSITNDIFQPSNSVMYGKEPRYNEPSI